MFKVVWKSFKYNRKNFLSFFMSEILSVAVIFMLIYIQEALSQVPGIKTEALQFAYQSELRKQLRIIIPCIILIMILVTGYSVKAYINTRIRDYKLFQLLGMRSWTHSRTAQHISFDEILEEGTTVDGELLFDIADPRSEFESEIIHKFYMEDFKAQLPGVDSKILQMRYDGHSLKEIAAAVGFKTPSAVSKHVEKIAERYDNFISDEYGKLLSKCIN